MKKQKSGPFLTACLAALSLTPVLTVGCTETGEPEVVSPMPVELTEYEKTQMSPEEQQEEIARRTAARDAGE